MVTLLDVAFIVRRAEYIVDRTLNGLKLRSQRIVKVVISTRVNGKETKRERGHFSEREGQDIHAEKEKYKDYKLEKNN